MKFTFRINQLGVVEEGLIGSVDLPELCLLDYLNGWFFCRKAECATVGGREFRWVDYEHAVTELPLLFNPQASIRTRKNSLCRMVGRLRAVGLVETVNVGRRLFFRLTDKAASLEFRPGTVTKSPPIVTPQRDESVTSNHDDTVTPARDDSGALIMDETDIKEANIKEPKHALALKSEEPVKSSSESPCCLTPEEQAAAIYAAYPLHAARKRALRAIQRALRTVPFEQLLEFTKQFGRLWAGASPEDLRYCPNPATWFGEERFNDVPESWRKPASTIRPPTASPTKFVNPNQFSEFVGKL